MDWVEVAAKLYPVAGLLLGAGGLTALIQARGDVKKGIKEVEIASDAADTDYLATVIRMQSEAILKPLQEKVDDLENDVKELQTTVEELNQEKFQLIRRADAYEVYIERLTQHIDSGQGPPAPSRPPTLKPLS